MLDFNLIYKQYNHKITGYVKSRILPRTECTMEIVDDIFMKIYNHSKLENDFFSFNENIASKGTWIWTIVNNCLIDYLRKIKIEKERRSEICELKPSYEYKRQRHSDYADTEILNNEIYSSLCFQSNIVMDIICELPEKYRKISELRFIDGLKYKEISQRLNLPIDTVKIQVSRAKRIVAKKSQLSPVYI